MILLDTNVISEALRATPEPRVVAWLDAQPLETLFLSVVSVALATLSTPIAHNVSDTLDLPKGLR